MTDGFILLARDRADADPSVRVGFTVTKKIGDAVVRNRLKRRLREAARRIIPGKALAGHDLVLIGRSEGLSIDYGKLLADLERALGKVAR